MLQNNTSDLYHYGIPGQKWGIRRYQNKDGSLTPAGRKRAAKLEEKYQKLTGKKISGDKSSNQVLNKVPNKPKTIKEMTNEELISRTNRLNLEKNYRDAVANKRQVSNGKKFFDKIKENVIEPSFFNIGKQVMNSGLAYAINKSFELDETPYKIHTNNKKKD